MSILISASCPHLYMYQFLFFCLLSLFNTSASHCVPQAVYIIVCILSNRNIIWVCELWMATEIRNCFFLSQLTTVSIFWHLHFGAGYFQEENIFSGNQNEEYLFTVLTLHTINIVTRVINLQWFMNMLRQVGLNRVLLNCDRMISRITSQCFFRDSSFVHIFRKLQHDHHTKFWRKNKESHYKWISLSHSSL